MGTSLEDLRVLQDAEAIADGVWQQVVAWEPFAREVVGGQLARAAKSSASVREPSAEYITDADDVLLLLLTDDELEWLQTLPNL